jgi:hypothetical protein
MKSRVFLCVLHLGLLILTGCGPSYGELKGTVSYQEKKLALGSVQVVGSDGIVRTGTINDDGTYEIKDILAGPIKATVNSLNPLDQVVAVRKKNEPPPAPKANPKWFAIPESYASFETTNLSFEAKSGPNQWDIKLK